MVAKYLYVPVSELCIEPINCKDKNLLSNRILEVYSVWGYICQGYFSWESDIEEIQVTGTLQDTLLSAEYKIEANPVCCCHIFA